MVGNAGKQQQRLWQTACQVRDACRNFVRMPTGITGDHILRVVSEGGSCGAVSLLLRKHRVRHLPLCVYASTGVMSSLPISRRRLLLPAQYGRHGQGTSY